MPAEGRSAAVCPGNTLAARHFDCQIALPNALNAKAFPFVAKRFQL
jgi:hypothetical protein